MQQYYTLDEAAKILHTTPDKVKEMAKKGEVRAFQDRGTLRFRSQEIVEVARARGLGSDPELQMGEAAGPKSPAPASRKSKTAPTPPSDGGKAAAPGGDKSGSGRKLTTTKPASGKSPPPKAASDSDVRLVADGSDLDFQIADDVKPAGKSSPPKSAPPKSNPPKSNPPKAPVAKADSPPPGKKSSRSKLTAPADADSGVRIVPLDDANDSDVKLEKDPSDSPLPVLGEGATIRPSDSDIRMDEIAPPGKKEGHVTEEIDLDAEAKQAEAAAKPRAGKPKTRHAKPGALGLPTSSPFELSESDVNLNKPQGPKTPKPSKTDDVDSSSDFELTAPADDSSPIELGSDEVKALTADDSDEVGLGELTGSGAGKSGINLQDPADSGISLEQGGSDEIEFELSLDAGATPKPAPAAKDDSSEFELSLDDSSGEQAAVEDEDTSSEFELSLDDSGEAEQAEADSDSEFELTLDAEGDLAPSEGGDALEDDSSGDRDIFETDFEVPALDEESGSEAVVLDENDTDLETSDFDLALDEEEAGSEDVESGSQVVTLDEGEEEADEGAETVAKPRKKAKALVGGEEEESELDLEIDTTAEAEEEAETAAAPVVLHAKPVPWGTWPGVLMIFSVLILFFVGLMCFELVTTMWGYHKAGRANGLSFVLHPLAKQIDKDLPED
jgi:excisionase family DNA binding protein